MINRGITKSVSFFKIIYCLLAILILYFAFLPVLSVVFSSIFAQGRGISFQDIAHALKYLKNSLIVTIPVTFAATALGTVVAFTLQRLRFRGNQLLKLLALLPLINPPFVGSLAFIMLFGKRGLITNKLLGLTISPYGLAGIITMQVLSLTSLAYILVSSSIKRVDPSLEEAARNLGSSSGRILSTVTLPLMLPEISSTALLVFLASMADFGTPLIIGGNFQTLASDLYIQITGLYDIHMAAVSGLFLLLPCLLAFVVHRYYLHQKYYSSSNIVSENIEFKQMPRPLKAVLTIITMLFTGVVVLKYGFIVIGAFTKQWGYNYSFTLQHLTGALTADLRPFINSIRLALIVALVSAILGVFLAYILKRNQPTAAGIIDFMATLPAAVPGILFGIGYLVTFKHPFLGIGKWVFPDAKPLVLLGTSSIIYFVCIARYLNVGLKSGYALLAHLDPNMEKASYNLGENEVRTFFRVTLPLLKPAFYTTFLKNFSTTMTTLGAIIFLLIPSNKVAVQQIFQRITGSEIGVAAAMGVLLSATSLVLLGIFYLLFNYQEIIKKMRSRGSWD